MGKINDTVATFNSALRTVLFAILMGAAGVGGWKAYSIYNEPQKKLDEKQKQLEQLSGQLANAQSTLADRD
jgi:membrane protein implicated in regulation of membrane protease activity